MSRMGNNTNKAGIKKFKNNHRIMLFCMMIIITVFGIFVVDYRVNNMLGNEKYRNIANYISIL